MEPAIEFAIDLVHYEPPRSGQPPNSLQRTDWSDPIEPLSIILLLNSGRPGGHTPFRGLEEEEGGVWGRDS